MADATSLSSSCSTVSLASSFEEDAAAASAKPSRRSSASTVKFLCSYAGKILLRHTDGKLRYIGGHTRVLSVDRAIPFSELLEKMREMCGWEAVAVRCKLPTEDLDALVTVKSDEDLANVVEEYERTATGQKIPSFLFPLPPKPSSDKGKSPDEQAASLPTAQPVARPVAHAEGCLHQMSARPSSRNANLAARNFHCHGPHPHYHHPHLHHCQHLQGHLPMPKPYSHLVHNGGYRL